MSSTEDVPTARRGGRSGDGGRASDGEEMVLEDVENDEKGGSQEADKSQRMGEAPFPTVAQPNPAVSHRDLGHFSLILPSLLILVSSLSRVPSVSHRIWVPLTAGPRIFARFLLRPASLVLRYQSTSIWR